MPWSKTFKLDGSDDKEIEKFVADVQTHGIGTAVINAEGDPEYVPHDEIFNSPLTEARALIVQMRDMCQFVIEARDTGDEMTAIEKADEALTTAELWLKANP